MGNFQPPDKSPNPSQTTRRPSPIMPKAERRTSGARAAPYPSIKPGDKPRSTSSTTTPTAKPSTVKSATKTALAEKPSASVNIPPKSKTASKSKKAGPTPVEKPSFEDVAPTNTVEEVEQSTSTKPTPKKKATPKKSSPNKSNDAPPKRSHLHRPHARHLLDAPPQNQRPLRKRQQETRERQPGREEERRDLETLHESEFRARDRMYAQDSRYVFGGEEEDCWTVEGGAGSAKWVGILGSYVQEDYGWT